MKTKRPSSSSPALKASRAGQVKWNRILNSIDRNAGRINEQLRRAESSYPELVSSFRLLAAYIGYMHLRGNGLPSLPTFPQGFCVGSPLICQCAQGNESACKALGLNDRDEIEVETGTGPACRDLWAAYQRAVERQRRALQDFLQGGGAGNAQPVVVEQTEVERLWNELHLRGCITFEVIP